MPSRRDASAFTLMEILIVVVILGILAAIVVPQFTSAAEESRASSLQMNLHRIRQQLEIYKSHHDGRYPDADRFAQQLTAGTDVVGDAGSDFGPYLLEIPNNPFTLTRDVGSDEPGTSAWYYDPATGDFRANDSAAHRAY